MLNIDIHITIHELLDHEAEGITVLQSVVTIYLSTHHDIPEDLNLQQQCCKSLKSNYTIINNNNNNNSERLH
jgi:hypothetical protein